MKKKANGLRSAGFMLITVLIAGLMAMAVLVGTASADVAPAWIEAHYGSYPPSTHEFLLCQNVYAQGYLGKYSEPTYGGRIYVVNHSDNWTNGTILIDVSGGNETVGWGSSGYFGGVSQTVLTWPTPCTPGRYDLILDLNVTGYNGVWTDIPLTLTQNITDPIWHFNVTGTAGINITKTANVSSATVGTVIGYTINVSNTGTVNMSDIWVNDSLLGNLVSGTLDLEPEAWHVIAPTPTHTINQTDACRGWVNNIVNVSGTDCCGDRRYAEDSANVTTNYTASLFVTKDANVTSDLKVGDVVGYKINVSNTGTVNISDIWVNDSLLGNLVSGTLDLEPEAWHVIAPTPTHTINQTDACRGWVNNIVNVSGTDCCGDRRYAEDSANVTTNYTASLFVTKDANVTSDLKVGDVVGYKINVSNTGTVNISDIWVNDSLLGNLVSGTLDLEPEAWHVIAPTPTHTINQTDACRGWVNNIVNVSGTDCCGDRRYAEDSANVTTIYAASLFVTKDANVTSDLKIGDVVGYKINVSNTGTVNMSDIWVNDSLLGNLVSGTLDLEPEAWHVIAPTPTHKINQTDACRGWVNNIVNVSGTDCCGDRRYAEDSANVTTNYTASLFVTKDANVTSDLKIGDVVGYTINVSNTGTVNMSDIWVNDSLLGNLVSGTLDLEPEAWHVIAPTPTHKINQTDACRGWVNNIVNVSGTDHCGDRRYAEDSANVTTIYAASLFVTKDANVTSGLKIGDVVGYTINVSNTGTVNMSDIWVNDSLLGNLVSGTLDLEPEAWHVIAPTPTHKINQTDACRGWVNNIVNVSGTDHCGDRRYAEDSANVTTIYAASLFVTKDANVTSGLKIGDVVGYTINVSNTGTVNMSDIWVNDSLLGNLVSGTLDLEPEAWHVIAPTPTHKINQTDACRGWVNNIVNVSGTDCCGDRRYAEDSANVTTIYAASLFVTKDANVTSGLKIGDVVGYTINVSNTGTVNMSDIWVNDSLLGNLVSGTLDLEPEAWHVIAPTPTHKINQTDACRGWVNNIVNVSGTDCCGDRRYAEDSANVTTIYAASIAINKTAFLNGTCPGSDPLNVRIGDTVTYCFNVTNTGDVNLTGVTVVDDVYGPVTLLNITLAPGGRTGGTVTHVVEESDAPFVINTATATGTPPVGDPVNDTDDCTINVTIGPEIAVNKTASLSGSCPGSDPLNVSIGDTVTYCFNVTNAGDVNLTVVTVNDNIYGPVTLGTTTLAPGETTEGTLTHVVVESNAPSVTDIATATGTPPVGNPVTGTDNCTINVTIGPEIEVIKTASLSGSCPGSDPLAVKINDTVTYCFNVTNTGDVNLTSVTVNDDVYGSVLLGTTTLAPGETTGGTLTHVVVESDAPSVTDIATATGTPPVGDPVNDTDDCTINVTIGPEIEVIKTASLTGSCPGSDPLAVKINDTVTYCFNVTNRGDVNLTGVTVVDDVYGPVTLLNITLAPGGRTGGTVTHVVEESDAPFVINTATATGTDPLGGTVTDIDDCKINVTMGPDIEVIKTASLSGACPGTDPLAVKINDTVTYCFNVTNRGDVNLTGVTVVDDVYGPVTLLNITLAPGGRTGGTVTHVVEESDAPFVINL